MKCLKIVNAILANQYKNLGRKVRRCIDNIYFNQECSLNNILANIYQYKNLGRKIHRCIANIYFNQERSLNNIIPSYFKIKIPKTSSVSKHYFCV